MARRNWKQQQSKTEYQEVNGQPKGLLHWKKLREEDKGRDTNKQDQANEKSTFCGEPGQHNDMEAETIPDQALQHDQVQEIVFPSIHEVCLVKNGNSDSVAGLPATNKSNPVLKAAKKKTNGPAIEKGVNLWEQHSETINAEKEQLHEESSWGTWSSAKKSSWSERALKGSARGPTMAFRRYKR